MQASPYFSSELPGKALQQNGLIEEEDTAFVLYHEDVLKERAARICQSFAQHSLHTVAVKACPLRFGLVLLQSLGFGAEVASAYEMQLSLQAGFKPGQIFFDSPAKTIAELRTALKLGISINIDSWQELERIAELLQTLHSTSRIGLRLNPQNGCKGIASTNVGDRVSKFGIALAGNEQRLQAAFEMYPWLQGLHLHIGSQGCPPSVLLEGVKRVYQFFEVLDSALSAKGRQGQLRYFDIGGGLPVSYDHSQGDPSVLDFARQLEVIAPRLFDGSVMLVSELGRYLFAHSAVAVSKVEYVKESEERPIIINHVGADLLLRKCYNPTDWHHEMSLLAVDGQPVVTAAKRYDVAGPLCFAGDFIGRDVLLPEAKPDDWLVIYDVGAYTLGMWSRYNSRARPKVLLYSEARGFEIVQARESFEQLAAFWE